MADTKIPNSEAKRLGFNLNPNQLTSEEYEVIKKEQQELIAKQEAAGSEFMWQHYNRVLRVLDESIARGSQAVVAAQRRARREQQKQRRAQQKGS